MCTHMSYTGSTPAFMLLDYPVPLISVILECIFTATFSVCRLGASLSTCRGPQSRMILVNLFSVAKKVIHLFSYIMYIASFFLFLTHVPSMAQWYILIWVHHFAWLWLAFFKQLLLKENSTLGLRAFCIEDPYQSCWLMIA